MICVVLAAGYAMRLYPLTENFPKPLLSVGGKPILNWLLDDVDEQEEITGHVIISNHKFFPIFQEWKDQQRYQKPITLLDDGTTDNDHRLGAVKDLALAMERLGLRDSLLVIAGDNMLDFSLQGFLSFAREKGTSCVMCHEENDLKRQQKTAVIVTDEKGRITSYEEKPKAPKGNLAVPPFYIYREEDAARIGEAMAEGCPADAPGSFAAWLSGRKDVHAFRMPGVRYDIGDQKSYDQVKEIFQTRSA